MSSAKTYLINDQFKRFSDNELPQSSPPVITEHVVCQDSAGHVVRVDVMLRVADRVGWFVVVPISA